MKQKGSSKGSSLPIIVAASLGALIGLVLLTSGLESNINNLGPQYYGLEGAVAASPSPDNTCEKAPGFKCVAPDPETGDCPPGAKFFFLSCPDNLICCKGVKTPTPTPGGCPQTCPHNPLTEQVTQACPQTPQEGQCTCTVMTQGGSMPVRKCKGGQDCSGLECAPQLESSVTQNGPWVTTNTYNKDPCQDAMGNGQCVCKITQVISKFNQETNKVIGPVVNTFLAPCK